MNKIMKFVAAIIVGILLGVVNAKILTGPWYSLSFWGLAGLLLGLWTESKKESFLVGIVYGFTVSFFFMIAGYNGVRPILFVLPFFAVLGLFGALCGAVLGTIGNFLRKIFKK